MLIVHELLHSLQTKKLKTSYMALKLGIVKVFDKIEWSFIEAFLMKLGFVSNGVDGSWLV